MYINFLYFALSTLCICLYFGGAMPQIQISIIPDVTGKVVTRIFESEYAKVHIQVNIHWNIHLHMGHSLNIHEFFRCCYLTGR